jgi:hypothetical protein
MFQPATRMMPLCDKNDVGDTRQGMMSVCDKNDVGHATGMMSVCDKNDVNATLAEVLYVLRLGLTSFFLFIGRSERIVSLGGCGPHTEVMPKPLD